MRPRLPTRARLAPYLDRIDAARVYANGGPLVRALESALADACGAPEAAVFSSGSMALVAALRALAERRPGRSRCLMPSWTFAGTAGSAVMAGLAPHFVDVDPGTWALDPEALGRRDGLDDVAAVIAVAPFGAGPVDVAGWDAFTARTGVPVALDAAAGFDAVNRAKAPGRTPVMLSLHATKALAAGEGGALLCTDSEVLARARQWGNFGFDSARAARVPGSNMKLSEYHAAVGLAALDDWPETRARLVDLRAAYLGALAGVPGVAAAPPRAGGVATSTFLVAVEETAEPVRARLAAHGVETRAWWGRGCHAEPAYRDMPRDPLPVTERLAAHSLGLPFFVDMTEGQVAAVAAALAAPAAGRASA